jgi:hypothetical protein
MAMLDITEAAATLAPDIAPKIPQAKTVATARPPLMCDSQFAPAVYRSRARPLEDEKKAGGHKTQLVEEPDEEKGAL